MQNSRALTFCAGLVVLSACAPETPHIDVKTTWGDTIADYGITPLYPPRENVYVGDIYLFIPDPCEASQTKTESKILQSAFLGSLSEAEIAKAFETSYGYRQQLPTSQVKSSAAPNTKGGASADVASLQKQVDAADANAKKLKTQSDNAQAAADKSKTAATTAAAAAAKKKSDAAATNLKTLQDKLATAKAAATTAQAANAPAQDSTTLTWSGGSLKLDAKGADKPSNVTDGTNSKSASGAAEAAPSGQPIASDSDPIFWKDQKAGRPYNRVRIAAFPQMALGTVSEQEISGSGPFAGLANLSGNASHHAEAKVDVSVSDVEVAEIPISTFYAAVGNFLNGPDNNTRKAILNPALIATLQANIESAIIANHPGCQVARKNPTLTFVSRVFYARTFDFNFSNSNALSASLRATTQVAVANTAPAATSSGDASTTTTVTTEAVNPATGPSAPYIGAGASYNRTNGLTLKQTYARPLAFGVDASLSYDYYEQLGTVINKTFANAQSALLGKPAASRQRTAPNGLATANFLRVADEAAVPLKAPPNTLRPECPPGTEGCAPPCNDTDPLCVFTHGKGQHVPCNPAPCQPKPLMKKDDQFRELSTPRF